MTTIVDGWEVADEPKQNQPSSQPVSNFNWKVSPAEQAARDSWSRRIQQNEQAVNSGQPSSLPRTRDLIPGNTDIPALVGGRPTPSSQIPLRGDTKFPVKVKHETATAQSDGWEIAGESAPEKPAKKSFSLGKELTGMAAGVADIAAGIPAMPISGLAGLLRLATGGNAEEASKTVSKTQEMLSPSSALTKLGVDPSYTTQTGTHDILMKIISAPHEYVSKPIADKYFELTGKPLPAAILLGVLDIPAYMIAAKGAGKVLETGAKPRSPQVLREELGYVKEQPKTVDTTKMNQTELPFGEQRIPTLPPFNVLPKERRAQLEAELNPPAERPFYRNQEGQVVPLSPEVRQGELFTDQRPYSSGELVQGRPAELTPPAVSARNRPEPFDTMQTEVPARPAQIGEMTSRQGNPYEMAPLAPEMPKVPEQLSLQLESVIKKAEEAAQAKIEAIDPEVKVLTDRGTVGDARARLAEENQRTNEQASYMDDAIPYQGQPSFSPFTGPGRRQSGALRVDQLLKKKGIAPGLVELRRAFDVETRPAAEVMAEMTAKGIKDISDLGLDAAQLGLPKQVALLTQNRLVKWAADHNKLIDEAAAARIRTALEGEAYKTNSRGFEHRVPGVEGALTIFREMFRGGTKKRSELIEMKDIWFDNIGKEKLTRENFKTEQQWKVFEVMRTNLDRTISNVNKARTEIGLAPIPKLNNYFMAMRQGDYFVRVKDSAGITRDMRQYSNAFEAKRAAKAAKEKFPDMDVKWEHNKKGKYDMADTSAFEEAANILAREGNSKLAQEMSRIHADILGHRGAGKHGLKRDFVEGFMGQEKGTVGLRNMEKAYEAYIIKANKYIANIERSKLKGELQKLPEEFKAQQQNALAYANDYLDIARGKTPKNDWLTAAAEHLGKRLGLGASMPHKAIQNASALITPMWLLTVRNFTANILQPKETLAAISRLNALGETNVNPFVAFFDGYKNMLTPDSLAIKGANWATRQGKLDPTITALLEWRLGDAPTSNSRAITEALKLLPSKIEQNLVRLPSFLIYEKALRQTMKDDVARFQKAAELVDHTMVDYGHASVPLIYNKMGLVGEAIKPLKQFPTNAFGQFFDYLALAKNHKEVAPLAYHLGTQLSVGGLKGIIGVAEATAIIMLLNTLFDSDIPTPAKLMHEAGWLPDALVMGGASTVLGADISSSISAPGIPSMLGAPAVEMGVKWAEETSNLIIKLAKGTATDADKLRAWLVNTPNAAHEWLYELYTPEDGLVPNPRNPNMEGVYQRSETEKWVASLTGLRSTQREGWLNPDRIWNHLTGKGERGEAQAREMAAAAKHYLMLDAQQKLEAISAITDLVANGKDIPDALLDQYIEEGGDPRNLGKLIKRRLTERQLTPGEQINKGGISPNKAHKLDRYKEYMELQTRPEYKKGEPQKESNDGWEVANPIQRMSFGESWTNSLSQRTTDIDRTPTRYQTYGQHGAPIGKAGSPGTSDNIPRVPIKRKDRIRSIYI